jgi:hypothetical protein
VAVSVFAASEADAQLWVVFDLGVPVAYEWATNDGRHGHVDVDRPRDGRSPVVAVRERPR